MNRPLQAVLILFLIGAAFGEREAAAQSVNEPGRVVVTVTTLDGTVHMPGVLVELRESTQATVLASTTTDATGLVSFADVPPGRYRITGRRAGFLASESAAFDVKANAAAKVLLDIRLTFVLPAIEVPTKLLPSPTDSVQPVSMSDMLSGDVLDVAPLVGDDFQTLMTLLPGVVRGPDGRLRVKGGQPTQSALHASSASLVDPSRGDFDLDLPGQSIESVEVLPNPFAAEYGRFSSSVTRIQTRHGTNEWEVKPGHMRPRVQPSLKSVRGFEPRFSIPGPLRGESRVRRRRSAVPLHVSELPNLLQPVRTIDWRRVRNREINLTTSPDSRSDRRAEASPTRSPAARRRAS